MKGKSLLLIFIISFIYILESLYTRLAIDSFKFNYVLRPFLWLGLAGLIWIFPREKFHGRLKLRKLVYFWSFNLAIIYILVTFGLGIFMGFGHSPYDHSVRGIFLNLVNGGSILLAREAFRSFIINGHVKKGKNQAYLLVSFFMAMINIPLIRYLRIESLQDLVKFLGTYLGPEMASSSLASYLVYLGGPLGSLIYLGLIGSFEKLAPILPDINWITTALIGILLPTFYIKLIKLIYENQSGDKSPRASREDKPLAWMGTSLLSIVIIWFAVGVFPIYPSVIATGSMEPMIRPGDIILVRKVLDKESFFDLEIGDVIQFRRKNILISHRIVQIISDEEGPGFITKGDNNSSEDSFIVRPEDLRGKILSSLPKLGWATLLIKSRQDINLEDIIN